MSISDGATAGILARPPGLVKQDLARAHAAGLREKHYPYGVFKDFSDFAIYTIRRAALRGRSVRFDITNMEDIAGVFGGNGKWVLLVSLTARYRH